MKGRVGRESSTPIPNRRNEKAQGPGEVITYTLPPDELAKLRSMPTPRRTDSYGVPYKPGVRARSKKC